MTNLWSKKYSTLPLLARSLIHLHISSAEASGPGPLRGMYRHLVQDHLRTLTTDWKHSGDFWVPVSNTPLRSRDHERLARLRAVGSIMALHTFHLGVGPHPISPFLFYLIIRNGPKSDRKDPPVMDFNLEFIRKLSPHAALALAPWFALTPEDPLPEDSRDTNNRHIFWLLSDASQGRPVRAPTSLAA